MPGLLASLLDLFFPPPCPGCGAPGTAGAFCRACAPLVELLPAWRCAVCAEPLPPPDAGPPSLGPPAVRGAGDRRCSACAFDPPAFDRALVAFIHGGPVSDAIHRLKYRGRREVAAALAALAVPPAAVALARFHRIAPIPLHPDRRRERGYDQALLIARAAARLSGLPLAPRLLARVRPTRPQVGLGRPLRAENVAGAFLARPCPGERIVLVDDVLTTGATASAAAAAVREAGAREVVVLAVARAAG